MACNCIGGNPCPCNRGSLAPWYAPWPMQVFRAGAWHNVEQPEQPQRKPWYEEAEELSRRLSEEALTSTQGSSK
jgi:hypothetical protein